LFRYASTRSDLRVDVLQGLNRHDAVLAVHQHVHRHEVRPLFAVDADRVRRRPGLHDAVSALLEHATDRRPRQRRIVNDKNQRPHCPIAP
jgi:hypothetical protein